MIDTTEKQQLILTTGATRLRPPKQMSGSEWALENVWFSAEDHVSKERYNYTRFPFQREILDAMCSPHIEEVVLMACSQIGKTVMQRITQGYFIDQDPAPMLMVQPTITLAESYSKDRFDPFARDTAVVGEKVGQPGEHGNKVLHKQFPGGHLTLAGANSAASLASRPIRVLNIDEPDRYALNVSDEGDPIELASARTRRFWNRKKIYTSSPTFEQVSKINALFQRSDQRFFFVPCPKCKKMQPLAFSKKHSKTMAHITNLGELKWGPNGSNVHYECGFCAHKIREKDRFDMVSKGKYKATNKAALKGDTIATGFHMNELYILDTPWAELVKAFFEAKKKREKLQVLVNTRFGETFDDLGEAPDYVHIYARRDKYLRSTVPPGVLFLTAGADVQNDRIEVELRGWGREEESWSIEHYIFMGATKEQKVFEKVDELLARSWKHPKGGLLKIKGLAIDTGGQTTQSVYWWCRQKQAERVFGIKGATQDVVVNIPRAVDVQYQGKKILNGLKLWSIGVSILKSALYDNLRLKRNKDKTYPAGYIHFPADYSEEYFKQLTAESLNVVERKAGKVLMWEKIRDRNEALDMAVYARAAAIIQGIERLTEDDWAALESQVSLAAPLVEAQVVDEQVPGKRKRRNINKGLGGKNE